MRRAIAPLLLALAIASPLLAQSAARRDGATREEASGPTTGCARLYHEGHSSTAVHRIVGRKLFEEIAAHPPAAR